MNIDAHQHFWQYDPPAYGWIGDNMQSLQRDFMPPDLKEELDAVGMDGCVAVQALQTEAETYFLLSLAKTYDFIKGVIGWVDLQSPSLEQRLRHFSQFDALKGIRHVVQDEPDDNFLLRPDFMKGVQKLTSYNLCYDILIFNKHLPVAHSFVRECPNQVFVLDHMAKPDIKRQRIAFWGKHIRALGKLPNVYCKISGIITEADWREWKPIDFDPYLDVVFEAFGADRLMFGSDWPVCTLAGRYRDAYQVLNQYISKLSNTERKKVMGKNAQKVYNI